MRRQWFADASQKGCQDLCNGPVDVLHPSDQLRKKRLDGRIAESNDRFCFWQIVLVNWQKVRYLKDRMFSTPPLPTDIVGDQSDPRAGMGKGGKKHTSGPLTRPMEGQGTSAKIWMH